MVPPAGTGSGANVGAATRPRKPPACDRCKVRSGSHRGTSRLCSHRVSAQAKRVLCHPHPSGCPRCNEKGIQCVSVTLDRSDSVRSPPSEPSDARRPPSFEGKGNDQRRLAAKARRERRRSLQPSRDQPQTNRRSSCRIRQLRSDLLRTESVWKPALLRFRRRHRRGSRMRTQRCRAWTAASSGTSESRRSGG